ncbi:MAG: Xanthine/uracil/thiamine/ascorbate permease family protein [Fibrobacteres bacterium]|nr:Xanthine/uracil/thiamine/ascorbate permease family protein [Fibrobacterota bacterium]
MACLVSLALPSRSQAGDCKAPDPIQYQTEASHVATCAPLTFSHYPPTSGNHFGSDWAKYGTHRLVLNPGYYVHNEEHGAVVFLINCHTEGDCEADFASLQRIADAFPQDPLCGAAIKHRIVIAGDTVMAKRFAAIAWGWSLTSDCLDSLAFSGFLKAHYAHSPENTCLDGTDFNGTVQCNAPLGLSEEKASGPSGSGQPAGGRFGRRPLWEWSLTGRAFGRLDSR